MNLKLLCVFALILPDLSLQPLRAWADPSLIHPLGCDGYGRDGLLRLCLTAFKSMGMATAVALGALGLGGLLALGPTQVLASVARTTPPILVLIPLAAILPALSWPGFMLLLAMLLAPHAEAPLRIRFLPLREGPALPSLTVLGASRWHRSRIWLPWIWKEGRPIFPSLWLGAFYSEVVVRALGLGPGAHEDSLGLLLAQELPSLMSNPTPLSLAAMVTVIGLAWRATPIPKETS